GMLADDQTKNIISGLNSGTSTIPFGAGVVRGAVAGSVQRATAASTAADFVGVAVYELNRAYEDGSIMGVPQDMDASILTMGGIWVQVAGTVTDGAPAFMGVGTSVANRWTAEEGAAATLAVAIPNAKFLDAGSAGSLVRLSIVVGG
ncbi:MAG: hypothetical protein GY881_02995, partial [Gammaproteobacteria bacterium]|nr:hypothetical protein [Gammaproteobacteria bacterium]